MKNLLFILLIFALPAISTADAETGINLDAALQESMKPLKHDREEAKAKFKPCLSKVNQDRARADAIIGEEVVQCTKDYVARSFTSYCEQKKKLTSADLSSAEHEALKEELEAKKNLQVKALIDDIEEMRKEILVGEEFIKKHGINEDVVMATLGLFMGGMVVGGVAGGAVSTVYQFGKLITRGRKAYVASKKSSGSAIVDLITLGTMRGAAYGGGGLGTVGAAFAGYKVYNRYIFNLVGTDNLCRIRTSF